MSDPTEPEPIDPPTPEPTDPSPGLDEDGYGPIIIDIGRDRTAFVPATIGRPVPFLSIGDIEGSDNE